MVRGGRRGAERGGGNEELFLSPSHCFSVECHKEDCRVVEIFDVVLPRFVKIDFFRKKIISKLNPSNNKNNI